MDLPSDAAPEPLADGTPPRCRDCGYILQGLTQPACPECGREFSAVDTSSFTYRVPFVWHAFWLPAFATALVVGLLWAMVFYASGVMGWGLFIGVPNMIGVLLGYRHRGSMRLGYVALVLVLAGVLVGLLLGGFAGIFCVLLLVGVFGGASLLGLFSGVLLGRGLGVVLKRSSFSQRSHLPLLAFVLLWPGLVHLAERAVAWPAGVQTVSTAVVVEATPGRAYDGWLFYGDVTHSPPLLLRLGLPTPRFTVGRIAAEGDVQVCIYTRGRLVKRATHVEPGRVLGFDVIAQERIEDRSVRLIDGRFTFDPVGDGHTRVTLTTRYQPLLTPRWMWRPIEHLTAGTMHRHVLRGMAERLNPPPVALRPAASPRPGRKESP